MATPKRASLPLFPIVVGVVIAIGLAVVVATVVGGDDDTSTVDVQQTRAVSVDGDPLPAFDGDSVEDPALGLTAPTVTGENFASEPLRIANDGRPKAIAFVAHWCPHCQAEVPRIEEWLSTTGLPEGVDLYFVSTRVSAPDGNYPPSEWLEREGVSGVPTIADDEGSTALAAYGAGGFPYLVYLDADNNVVLRTSGEYGSDPQAYTPVFEALASGEPPVDPRG